MPFKFNPCRPCCGELEQVVGCSSTHSLLSLMAVYTAAGYGAGTVSSIPDEVKLYVTTGTIPGNVDSWLALGNKRLVMVATGEWATLPGNPASITFNNNQIANFRVAFNSAVAARGVALSLAAGGVLSSGNVGCAAGAFGGAHYLAAGMTTWGQSSCLLTLGLDYTRSLGPIPISGGTPLVTYQGDVSMAVARLASVNSEVILSGDMQAILNPGAVDPDDVRGCALASTPFLLRLVELDVP